MASRSLNRIQLIGNLTRDPELKYTPSGTAVCTFGVATNRSWTTADGQIKEDVQYHRIVSWQKLAELCGKLLTKGRKVYLEGRITYRTFTGKDGQQRSITEIVLDDFIVFGDGKRAVNEAEIKPETTSQQQPPVEEETPAENTNSAAHDLSTNISTEESSKKSEDVNPDDIPF